MSKDEGFTTAPLIIIIRIGLRRARRTNNIPSLTGMKRNKRTVKSRKRKTDKNKGN